MAEKEEGQRKREYEVLPEDYVNYDLSFKLIVIGNSGNTNLLINIPLFLIKQEQGNLAYQFKPQNMNLSKIIWPQQVLNFFHLILDLEIK